MPTITIKTHIKAPTERVFDLSRSIDLHQISTQQTFEKAIAGKTSGLIGLNETVTWKAQHFGMYHTLTSRITELNRPLSFTDEMVNGAFKSFKHQHKFKTEGNETLVVDIFEFQSPLGLLGRLADVLFLKRYMMRLLQIRNGTIKSYAESDKWKTILD